MKMEIYVDGSYSDVTREGSYAFVVVKDEQVVYQEKGRCEDTIEKLLLGAHYAEMVSWEKALMYTVRNHIQTFSFFYDSETVYSFCLGEAKGKSIGIVRMIERVQNMIEKRNIQFQKVKSHSDNKWNDYVHGLAISVVNKHRKKINVTKEIEKERKEIEQNMDIYYFYLFPQQREKIKNIIRTVYDKKDWKIEDVKHMRKARHVIDKTVEKIQYVNEEVFGTEKKIEILEEAEELSKMDSTHPFTIEKRFRKILQKLQTGVRVGDKERFWFYHMYKRKQEQIKKRNKNIS